jgi:acetyl coenzyme A synthetase (ADP forming)-like protein
MLEPSGMTASAYPRDLESDIVLRDGLTLRIRPVREDDAPAVLQFFQQLSQQSLYQRFMALPALDLSSARDIVDVDYDHRFVLVAERGQALAGIAGYYRDEAHPDRAEAAFAVSDDLQGRGLGTRLLERLGEIGRDRNLRAFDAYVLGGNVRMMNVFLRSGFTLQQGSRDGVVHVTLSLDPTREWSAASAQRAQIAAAASMRPFFEPRAVAVIGANREPGRIGSEVFRNLRESGFTGTLVPVHPSAAEIGGITAVPSVAAFPGEIDLAVVLVPAAHVLGVVDECIAKGVKAIVVISAGFAETGPAGAARQAELVDRIRAAGIRLIGPNCMGIINTDPAIALNATFSPVYPPAGRLAFSTQSGALGLAILDYVKRLNLGISSFASIANTADVSGNDLIQYRAEDARTEVILLYLESFGNPRKFAQIARRVGRRKPMVAVKAGRSSAGARAATSHTGARATSDVLVDTLLRDSGVIRTNTLEELFDVASLIGSQPVPAGRRVAILTNAGGPAILAADACEANGLVLPPLGEATCARLREFLPAAASVANPVDMIASASAEHYRLALDVVARDEDIDSIIVIFIPPLVTSADAVAAAIRSAPTAGKPVLATFMGAQGVPPVLAPIPAYAFPESAAVALARVTGYGEWLRRPMDDDRPMDPETREAIRALVLPRVQSATGWLSMADGVAVLNAAGVKIVSTKTVHDADAAVAAADALGYPVAVKAFGATLIHKTEAAAVKLRLESAEAVRAAFADFTTRLGNRFEGAVVQPMVEGGVEVVVGGLNDAAFGPLVMCGTGGVLVELIADTSFAMCPIGPNGAAALIDRMKGKALLRGFRGARAVDEQALEQMLVRVSQLIDAVPEVLELDLNPVMVLPHGAIAADVRINVGPRARPPAGRRIAY